MEVNHPIPLYAYKPLEAITKYDLIATPIFTPMKIPNDVIRVTIHTFSNNLHILQ